MAAKTPEEQQAQEAFASLIKSLKETEISMKDYRKEVEKTYPAFKNLTTILKGASGLTTLMDEFKDELKDLQEDFEQTAGENKELADRMKKASDSVSQFTRINHKNVDKLKSFKKSIESVSSATKALKSVQDLSAESLEALSKKTKVHNDMLAQMKVEGASLNVSILQQLKEQQDLKEKEMRSIEKFNKRISEISEKLKNGSLSEDAEKYNKELLQVLTSKRDEKNKSISDINKKLTQHLNAMHENTAMLGATAKTFDKTLKFNKEAMGEFRSAIVQVGESLAKVVKGITQNAIGNAKSRAQTTQSTSILEGLITAGKGGVSQGQLFDYYNASKGNLTYAAGNQDTKEFAKGRFDKFESATENLGLVGEEAIAYLQQMDSRAVEGGYASKLDSATTFELNNFRKLKDTLSLTMEDTIDLYAELAKNQELLLKATDPKTGKVNQALLMRHVRTLAMENKLRGITNDKLKETIKQQLQTQTNNRYSNNIGDVYRKAIGQRLLAQQSGVQLSEKEFQLLIKAESGGASADEMSTVSDIKKRIARGGQKSILKASQTGDLGTREVGLRFAQIGGISPEEMEGSIAQDRVQANRGMAGYEHIKNKKGEYILGYDKEGKEIPFTEDQKAILSQNQIALDAFTPAIDDSTKALIFLKEAADGVSKSVFGGVGSGIAGLFQGATNALGTGAALHLATGGKSTSMLSKALGIGGAATAGSATASAVAGGAAIRGSGMILGGKAVPLPGAAPMGTMAKLARGGPIVASALAVGQQLTTSFEEMEQNVGITIGDSAKKAAGVYSANFFKNVGDNMTLGYADNIGKALGGIAYNLLDEEDADNLTALSDVWNELVPVFMEIKDNTKTSAEKAAEDLKRQKDKNAKDEAKAAADKKKEERQTALDMAIASSAQNLRNSGFGPRGM
jgi:hypothetical protein